METHTSWCQGHSWRAASRMGSWAGALEEVKLERVLQETRPVLLPFSTHFAWVVLALPYPQELCGVFQGVPELHLVITHGAPHDNSRRCCTWCRHAYGLLCLGTHMACGLFRVKQPKQTRHVLATWRRCHKCTLASLALWRSRRWASQRAKLWKVSCTPLSFHECTLTLEPLLQSVCSKAGWEVDAATKVLAPKRKQCAPTKLPGKCCTRLRPSTTPLSTMPS